LTIPAVGLNAQTTGAATVVKPPGNYTEGIILSMQVGSHHWHLDMSYDRPISTMQEYVQDGETGQNWSEMITLVTLKNHPEVSTAKYIGGIVQSFRAICAKVEILDLVTKTETDSLRQSVGLPASYQTVSALMQCDDPKPSSNPAIHVKKHEVVWFKGIQGWLTAYIVQRAWHSDDIGPDSILGSEKTRSEWREALDQITIAGLPDDKRSDLSNGNAGK